MFPSDFLCTVFSPPLAPLRLDLVKQRSQEYDQDFVPIIVFQNTLAVARHDIFEIVLVEEISFYLTRQVFRVEATVVDLIQHVLHQQPPPRKHDNRIQVPCLGLKLFRLGSGSDPAANGPVSRTCLNNSVLRLSLL